MRHPNDTGHFGTKLPIQASPKSNTGDIVDWDPAYEKPLSRHAQEDAAWLESRAKKGIPVPRPDSFPSHLWDKLSLPAQAEFTARWNYGEEDGGGLESLESWRLEIDETLTKPYLGPGDRRRSPSTARPSSMIGRPEPMRPYDVWQEIEETRRREGCPPLPPGDAENLHVVYTGREGQLMLLVIADQDLARYVSGLEPCPVIVDGSPGYVTIRGEAQGFANQGQFGAAAGRVGRLAFFAGGPAKASVYADDVLAVSLPLGNPLG